MLITNSFYCDGARVTKTMYASYDSFDIKQTNFDRPPVNWLANTLTYMTLAI